MRRVLSPVALFTSVLFVQAGFAAEPITDLQPFEDEIGTWTTTRELDNDDPILGKKGTRMKIVKTVEWGPGKKFIFQRTTRSANGKQTDGAWTLTGIDPSTKQVVTHWFGPSGGHSTAGRWYRDLQNAKKRILQWHFTGRNNEDVPVLGSGVLVVEDKDANTSITQYVNMVFSGEAQEDATPATWTRVKTSP